MTRTVLFLLIALVVLACGKNEGIRAVGAAPGPVPYTQAPPPPGYQPGGYYPPSPQYPSSPQNPTPGYGYQPPYFQPQMPQGMPPGYYPFLPIDNYMRRNPYTQQYWQGYWGQWQQYAQNHRYNQYDFNRFWFEFCPQQWSYTDYAELYNYYDANVYFWVTPQTQFSPQADPGYFWEYYQGLSYQPLDNYGYCNAYCY